MSWVSLYISRFRMVYYYNAVFIWFHNQPLWYMDIDSEICIVKSKNVVDKLSAHDWFNNNAP